MNDLIKSALSIVDEAIEKLMNGDVGAHWDSPVIEAARELYFNDPPEFYRKRAEIKAANKDSQITVWTKDVKNNGDSEGSNAKADLLVQLVRGSCVLYHDDRDNSYATFQQDDHFENWPLGSEGFNKWISYKAFKELGFTPSHTAFTSALSTLKGFAIHEGEEQQVYFRCAPITSGFLIDLTNKDWSAIHVTDEGWEITNQPERKFIRSSTAAPIPDPIEGDFSLLWKHLNNGFICITI